MKAAATVASVAVAMMVALLSTSGAAHPTGSVTWSTVAGVIERRCSSCHGAGGSAAPVLDGYDAARTAADAMKRAVLERRMPPSYVVEGFGDLSAASALTPMEATWIADWADGGAPDDPPSSEDAPGLSSGEAPRLGSGEAPRLGSGQGPREVPVVHAHEHHSHGNGNELVLTAPARATDRPSHTFELPTTLDGDRWIRGWEVRPGTASAVSAVLSIAPGTQVGTWTAGEEMTMLPDGIGVRLPAGATVLLTMRYRRSSERPAGETGIRFLLSESPARPLETLPLPCGTSRLPRDIEAIAVRPAAAGGGESLTLTATRSDGSVEPLAWFRNFPSAHNRTYWFRRPVALGAGTSVVVAAADAECGAELEYVTR